MSGVFTCRMRQDYRNIHLDFPLTRLCRNFRNVIPDEWGKIRIPEFKGFWSPTRAPRFTSLAG